MRRIPFLATRFVSCLGLGMWLIIPAAAHAPHVRTQAPGFYRMMLGDFEITVLSDGTASRHIDEIMSKPDQIRKTFANVHQALPIELSINAFLINTGSQLILVDTGAGELFAPASGGWLIANLQAAGYQPEHIDAVLVTHMHADHSGGLSLGGRRVFSNALVYVSRHDSPEITIEYDMDRDAAIASRKRLLADAAKQGTLIGGAHISFPGLGHVRADAQGYSWIALPYSTGQ